MANILAVHGFKLALCLWISGIPTTIGAQFLPPLQAASVEGSGREARNVQAVEAADIDGDHFAAAWLFSAGKRSHAALPAEQVMDGLLVELVIHQLVGAG